MSNCAISKFCSICFYSIQLEWKCNQIRVHQRTKQPWRVKRHCRERGHQADRKSRCKSESAEILSGAVALHGPVPSVPRLGRPGQQTACYRHMLLEHGHLQTGMGWRGMHQTGLTLSGVVQFSGQKMLLKEILQQHTRHFVMLHLKWHLRLVSKSHFVSDPTWFLISVSVISEQTCNSLVSTAVAILNSSSWGISPQSQWSI